MNLSQCDNRRSQSVAMGQELPRHLTGAAAEIAPEADTPVIRRGGG
jgi:hypothetical protein